MAVTAETETRTENLRPFWGRVLVLPSGVDEHERSSGLIVPAQYEGDDKVKRGVVVHIDGLDHEATESMDAIRPGTVVYYVAGTRVLDAIILDRHEILAYEVE